MKFKINNVEWKIEEKTQKEIKEYVNKRADNQEEKTTSVDTRYYGITYCDIDTIFIDKDLPADRKRNTLKHELAHCYIESYITHKGKTYDEEDVADIVANSNNFINEVINKYFGGKNGANRTEKARNDRSTTSHN